MKRLSPTLASAGLGAIFALAGCSDDPRVSDGDRFSETTTGVPGVVLIDNMEDGTQYLLSDDGRVGLWYVYSDESVGSSQQPLQGFPMFRVLTPEGRPIDGNPVPARPCGRTDRTPFFDGEAAGDCAFVARTWGTGQRGWGAGMGLDLNGEGGIKNPFDASAYGGIGFYARGTVRNGAMRVNVQDIRTTPESAAAADRRIQSGLIEGRCDDSAMSTRCNDHFGRGVTITPEWQWFQIPFSCMSTGNWGYPGMELLTSGVVGVQFQISGPDTDDNGQLDMVPNSMPPMTQPLMAFDFAIDNLAFLDKSLVGAQPSCPP